MKAIVVWGVTDGQVADDEDMEVDEDEHIAQAEVMFIDGDDFLIYTLLRELR